MVRLTIVMAAPAATARRLAEALRVLGGTTRLERGCLACNVWTTEPAGDAGWVVRYEERWASEATMEARVRSDDFTKLLEVVEGAPETPEVEFEFVARRQGLEYVEAVRAVSR